MPEDSGLRQMNPTFLCSSKELRLGIYGDAHIRLDQAILIGADLSEVDRSGADLRSANLNDGCMAQNQALIPNDDSD